MFLIFSSVLDIFLFQENLLFTSSIEWYVRTHESAIFIMGTHWDDINDYITGKYFQKRLYEY